MVVTVVVAGASERTQAPLVGALAVEVKGLVVKVTVADPVEHLAVQVEVADPVEHWAAQVETD